MLTLTLACAVGAGVFIVAVLFARTEQWLSTSTAPTEVRAWVESKITVGVEQIDDFLYRRGTLALIDEARKEVFRQFAASQGNLGQAVDLAFLRMESNVDSFLDWYYSLGGEYTRIASMLGGQFEAYMESKLSETLDQTGALRAVEQRLAKIMEENAEAIATFNALVERIKQENRINPGEKAVTIVRTERLAHLVKIPKPNWMLSLESRAGASLITGGGAGMVAGYFAKRMLGRVLGAPIFKTAVQAVVRIVISKTGSRAAGGAAGAMAGGAAGSVVPGVGTTVGAVVGLIVGLATTVAVDAVLVEIEEAVNREQFKGEILRALAEARESLRFELLPEDPAGPTNLPL